MKKKNCTQQNTVLRVQWTDSKTGLFSRLPTEYSSGKKNQRALSVKLYSRKPGDYLTNTYHNKCIMHLRG